MLKRIAFITLVMISMSVHAEDRKFKLGNKINITPVSGYASDYVELAGTGPYVGVTGISWGEKTDDPCSLFVHSAHINKDREIEVTAGVNAKDHVFGEVVKKYYGGARVNCAGNGKAARALGKRQYVRKIRVCTTDKKKTKKNKLKGIRLWFATLEKEGYRENDSVKLIKQSSPQEALHKPHCDKWHKAVSCDKGEIATKLRVHYHDNATYPSVSGISMVCKKVNFKKVKVKTEPKKPSDREAPKRNYN